MKLRTSIGEVTDNDDKERLGRIKVLFPDFLGGEYPDWIEPVVPFAGVKDAGWVFIPPIGSMVEVEFHGDDPMLIDSVYPRYRGGVYTTGNSFPKELLENYTKRFGWKTPGGHLIIFDDTVSGEIIQIKHKNGLEILIKDGKLYLGSENNSESVVLFDKLKNWLATQFQCYTAWGPSGPITTTSLAAFTESFIASPEVKAKK